MHLPRLSVLTLIGLWGCQGDGLNSRPLPTGHSSGTASNSATVTTLSTDSHSTTAVTETQTETGSTSETSACPPAMASVSGLFCIDAYEAALEEFLDGSWQAFSPYDVVSGRTVRATVAAGSVPQGYISGDEADAACENADKRLCTSDEWLSACRGSHNWTWPYGDSYQSGSCNDLYTGGHPVTDYFGTSDGVWDSTHMNDPGINQQAGTVAPGGEYAACVSEAGAYDMHGNLHEWVDDADGTFRGGFYADAAINGDGCTYTTTAHTTTYHDYSTGFRCCSEVLGTD